MLIAAQFSLSSLNRRRESVMDAITNIVPQPPATRRG